MERAWSIARRARSTGPIPISTLPIRKPGSQPTTTVAHWSPCRKSPAVISRFNSSTAGTKRSPTSMSGCFRTSPMAIMRSACAARRSRFLAGTRRIDFPVKYSRVLLRVELGEDPAEAVRLQHQFSFRATGSPALPVIPKTPVFDLEKLPAVEAFDFADVALDSEPDANPGPGTICGERPRDPAGDQERSGRARAHREGYSREGLCGIRQIRPDYRAWRRRQRLEPARRGRKLRPGLHRAHADHRGRHMGQRHAGGAVLSRRRGFHRRRADR